MGLSFVFQLAFVTGNTSNRISGGGRSGAHSPFLVLSAARPDCCPGPCGVKFYPGPWFRRRGPGPGLGRVADQSRRLSGTTCNCRTRHWARQCHGRHGPLESHPFAPIVYPIPYRCRFGHLWVVRPCGHRTGHLCPGPAICLAFYRFHRHPGDGEHAPARTPCKLAPAKRSLPAAAALFSIPGHVPVGGTPLLYRPGPSGDGHPVYHCRRPPGSGRSTCSDAAGHGPFVPAPRHSGLAGHCHRQVESDPAAGAICPCFFPGRGIYLQPAAISVTG